MAEPVASVLAPDEIETEKLEAEVANHQKFVANDQALDSELPFDEPNTSCRRIYEGVCMTSDECYKIKNGEVGLENRYEHFSKVFDQGDAVHFISKKCESLADEIRCCTVN